MYESTNAKYNFSFVVRCVIDTLQIKILDKRKLCLFGVPSKYLTFVFECFTSEKLWDNFWGNIDGKSHTRLFTSVKIDTGFRGNIDFRRLPCRFLWHLQSLPARGAKVLSTVTVLTILTKFLSFSWPLSCIFLTSSYHLSWSLSYHLSWPSSYHSSWPTSYYSS